MSETPQCGLCGFYPKWLKNRGTTRNFIVVYSLLGTVQAMAFIYIVVTLTTIEKRFKIPSRTTGIILSGNEISQSLSLVLTYYGGSGHRPRWIASGVACSALSCLVLALPHFLYGPGKDAMVLTKEYLDHTLLNVTVGDTERPLCPQKGIVNRCDEETESDVSIVPRLLVFLSQFILGIGTTLYYGLGQTYLDDNTKKKNTPLLLGVTFALRTVGPVVGFVLGYACLSLYIDPSLHPVIEQSDPRWLGAWWLGWIILGITMGIFAILMAMFPRNLIKTNKKSEEKFPIDELALKEQKTSKDIADTPIVESAFQPTLKDFPNACKRMFKNKLLSCNNVSAVFYILGASVYVTFIAKYLEVQYNTSPGGGTVLSGPITLVGMVMGFLLSGYVISKFRPSPRPLLFWNVIVGFCFIFGQIGFIFMNCPGVRMQGIDLESMQINLTSTCNAHCMCDNVKYDPVCHEPTMTTFFSACHAGCTKILGEREFGDCNCVREVFTSSGSSKDRYDIIGSEDMPRTATVKSGQCDTECKMAFLLFAIVTCLVQTLACSGRIGNVLVNYRCVKKEDKSFAQGITIMIISLFALIPGPIIFGAIIDSTCLVWDQSCGTRGNCWFYHKDNFRYYVNVSAAGLTLIGVLFDIAVCYLGKDLDLYGDLDIDDKRRDFIKDDFPSFLTDSKRKYLTGRKEEAKASEKFDTTSKIDNECKKEQLADMKESEQTITKEETTNGGKEQHHDTNIEK